MYASCAHVASPSNGPFMLFSILTLYGLHVVLSSRDWNRNKCVGVSPVLKFTCPRMRGQRVAFLRPSHVPRRRSCKPRGMGCPTSRGRGTARVLSAPQWRSGSGGSSPTRTQVLRSRFHGLCVCGAGAHEKTSVASQQSRLSIRRDRHAVYVWYILQRDFAFQHLPFQAQACMSLEVIFPDDGRWGGIKHLTSRDTVYIPAPQLAGQTGASGPYGCAPPPGPDVLVLSDSSEIPLAFNGARFSRSLL